MATKQPKQKRLKIDATWCKKHRSTSSMNQRDFWRQYGVTQSSGSRYESEDHPIPLPVRMLIALETGMATMEDLTAGRLAGMV